jgi:hypothetical protein
MSEPLNRLRASFPVVQVTMISIIVALVGTGAGSDQAGAADGPPGT